MTKSTKSEIDVMIVEDDEIAASSYASFIKNIGSFEVTFIANTGEQALELLTYHKPKLLLLDVFLPDFHGIELMWEIRKRYRGIDIILITASNDTETVAEAIRGGAFSYIIKPVMMNRFINTLKHYQSVTSKFDQTELLVQNEVDSLFPPQTVAATPIKPPSQQQLPKGIDKLTLLRITDAIAQLEYSINADECAELAGVSHSTARRYLEYLASNGTIEVSSHYGTVGRPERRYQYKRKDNRA